MKRSGPALHLSAALNITGHAAITIGDATLHIFALRNGDSGAVKMRVDVGTDRGEEEIFSTPKDMHAAIGTFLRRWGEWQAIET